MTAGFTCRRGPGFGAIHDDADRLKVPLTRQHEDIITAHGKRIDGLRAFIAPDSAGQL